MISRPSRVALAQASVFFPEGANVIGHAIYRRLPDSWLQRFDAEPLLLPRPAEAPREFPALVLRNRSEAEQLTLSPARADLRRTPRADEDVALPKFFEEAAAAFVDLRKVADVRVGRLAAIAHRLVECESPALELAKYFCRDDLVLKGPLNRPENFELHAHKRFRMRSGVEVNSWVRNKAGTSQETNIAVVVVEQDINTLAEKLEEVSFQDKEILDFFASITSELDDALNLYYPQEPQDG